MFILLFLLWIVLNGKITLEICLFGLAISAAVYYFMIKFLEYEPNDAKMLRNFFRILIYIVVLAKEIVVSNFQVIKFVLNKEIDIQPQIVFFKVPLKTEMAKTVLANSITLTPGTITINVEDDIFCVHALDYTLAENFEESIFIKLLLKMEGK